MEFASVEVPWVALPPSGAPKGAREWGQAYPETKSEEGLCPFVSISTVQTERLLVWAAVTPQDIVCDLGFGDGAFLIGAASSAGCKCIGAEINGDLVQQANANAVAAGGSVSSLIDFTEGSFEQLMLTAEFAKVTLVFVHLVPNVLRKILPQLRACIAAGARVVSQRFEVPGLESQKKDELACGGRDDLAQSYFGDMGRAFLYSL